MFKWNMGSLSALPADDKGAIHCRQTERLCFFELVKVFVKNRDDAMLYIFWHTYLTIAASSGLDIKTLQAIAGHADIKMTMNCYVHKREEKIIEANDLISGSFTALWQFLWQLRGSKKLYTTRLKRLLFDSVCDTFCDKHALTPKTTWKLVPKYNKKSRTSTSLKEAKARDNLFKNLRIPRKTKE